MQFNKRHWLSRARTNANNPDWKPYYIAALERVVTWANSKGYAVYFSSQARKASIGSKNIIVPSGVPAYRQLMYLLHEAGHVSVECSKPTKRFSRGYNAYSKKARQLNHLVDIIDEELDAWQRGWLLANRLGIKLCEERYNRLKVRSVKTYIMLVSQWHVKQRLKRVQNL